MSQSDCAPTQRYSIPHGFLRLRHSLSPPIPGTAVSGHALSRSTRKQPDRTHVACMPDTTWPINGRPPGSSRDYSQAPVSMPPKSYDTSNSDCLPDPHLTHQVRLFPHRSPRQASTNAAVGGLEPPPAGRLRRAYLHLPCNTASRSSTYIKLPSAFGTQLNGHVAQATFPEGPTAQSARPDTSPHLPQNAAAGALTA
jgi:hypothetical protein